MSDEDQNEDSLNTSKYFLTANEVLASQSNNKKRPYSKREITDYFQSQQSSINPYSRIKKQRERDRLKNIDESDDDSDEQNGYFNVVGDPLPKKNIKKSFNTYYSHLKRHTLNKPYLNPIRGNTLKNEFDNVSSEEKSKDEPTKENGSKIFKPFIAPYKNKEKQNENKKYNQEDGEVSEEAKLILQDLRSRNLEPNIIDRILNEIIDKGKKVDWCDIAGLDFAKKTIEEIVVLPMLKPQLFVGLRSPCKGLLLFGPPGTGKTLIGKCIASQSSSTFFSISASSLTSKWIGEGEKMVRALFVIARIKAPSVIFIDEIDSLLTQRSDCDHESSRRLKTEFLVQFDGLNSDSSDRLLVIGATNRPQELDEAARRRFVKRLYIGLPTREARKSLISRLISAERHSLDSEHIVNLCSLTKGYSGADLCSLCCEAAYGPIRRIRSNLDDYNTKESLPPITFDDFRDALATVRPTVAKCDLKVLLDWNKQFGSVQWKVEELNESDENSQSPDKKM